MRLANRLCLIVVLLALPAAIAHATKSADNLEPCRTYTNVSDCTKFCTPNNLCDTCACFWDDPTTPDGLKPIALSVQTHPFSAETLPA